MDLQFLLLYIHNRKNAIERNKTHDMFCAGCLMAADPKLEKSACCKRDIITKEQAIDIAERAIEEASTRLLSERR